MSDDNGIGTPSNASEQAEFRALQAELKLLDTNVTLARMAFARSAGLTFNNARDMYGVLGYKDLITVSDYRSRYQRGGVAGRIVDVFPNATWRGSMELIEDADLEDYTTFEQAWADLDQRLQIQAKLLRVDKLAGLSTYAVLLIGAPGDLEQELPKGRPEQLLYLTPFAGGGGPQTTNNLQVNQTVADGADASIFEYDLDPKSKRFGMPKSYQLKRLDIGTALPRPVHWSRVVHVAEGLLDDEVFGQPVLERVWNLLDDLDKIAGGGSEAFWLRANQGMHIDVDKDMVLSGPEGEKTVADLKAQAEAYKHHLTRWLRTRGVSVETLGSDVANFANPQDAIITLIAGAKGIPKRILTGSEMGELASSQDRDNWKDQINGRQTGYAGPYIVRPLVDRLVAYGYLPTPKDGPDKYEVRWPQIQTLTEQEKVSGAQGWASVNQTYGEVVYTDAEIRDKWSGLMPLSDEQRAEIDERAAEKLKQQQEAMAAAKPDGGAEDEDEEKNPFSRAASAYEPQPGDEELVRVLAEAIECGNADVVAQIVGLHADHDQSDHGNRDGASGGNSSGRDDREIQEAVKDKPVGTVVLKSKYGEVKISNPRAGRLSFRGYRKNGEAMPAKSTLREAKESLREPTNPEMFRSGYLREDVAWKELKS